MVNQSARVHYKLISNSFIEHLFSDSTFINLLKLNYATITQAEYMGLQAYKEYAATKNQHSLTLNINLVKSNCIN